MPGSSFRDRIAHGAPHVRNQLPRRPSRIRDEIAFGRKGLRRMASWPESAARNHRDPATVVAPVERRYDVGGGQAAPHDQYSIIGMDSVQRVVGQSVLDESRIAAERIERRRNSGFRMCRRDDEQVGLVGVAPRYAQSP